MKKQLFVRFLAVVLGMTGLLANIGQAETRIKDLTTIKGAQDNELIGYGLIVGLKGTGDNDISTVQAVANMLNNFGITVNANELKLKNTAAVIVTATLPAFAKGGTRLDVTVSSYAGAKSLQGGMLLQTPLIGADRNVYAVAQGAVSIGGFNVGQADRATQKNHEQVGRVAAGAIVESTIPTYFTENGTVSLILREAEPKTAFNIANKINAAFELALAEIVDPSQIQVKVPPKFLGQEVALLAMIGDLEVDSSSKAVIVINERTGTVVMGEHVGISTVAISHGNLTLSVKGQEGGGTEPGQEQGEGAGGGEEKRRLILLQEGTDIAQVVKVLNAIGVTPRDMIAIFQALRASGALRAEIVVM